MVYTTRTEALFKPVVDAFQREVPGVSVVLLTGRASELASRLLEERANPKADVFISTDMLTTMSLAGEGAFELYESPAVQAVPEAYRAGDAAWVALTLRPRVILYNTELVQPGELPQSVLDLADPKWKGQVGSADSTNGSLMAHLAALRSLLGDGAVADFTAGLVANETQFFGGHTEVRKAVGAGELKLGLVNHYYYHLSKAEGAPVGIVYPDQGEGRMGLVVNTTTASVVKGGPRADLARLFVEFMLSPRGQHIYAEKNFEYPVLPGVPLADGVAPLNQFRLANVTPKSLWDQLQPVRAMSQRAGLP